MKKIISIFALFVIGFNCITQAEHNISVYAIVWNVNKPPRIQYVDPDFNPILLSTNELISFSFGAYDDEWEIVYFTITSDDWAVSLDNWKFQADANINFMYKAPHVAPSSWFSKIYITLNDGINFVVKEINLYIY